MKSSCFFSLLLLLHSWHISAQTDTTALQQEVETKLKSGSANVSAILTGKSYLGLHPQTTFRELIKKYCTTGILAISPTGEPGRKIKVTCRVRDENGKALAGVLVYLYQTDSRGWYAADAPHVLTYEGDMRHARLFGYIKTDENGEFELHTIKPSGYPRSDLPAHIHIHFWSVGYQPYATELLFDDDDRLIGRIREQAIESRFLISKPEKTTAPFIQQFSYTIVLHKQQ